MKVGKKGKAAPHAAYIVREGQYAKRLERGEKLEATEAGNMPAWAKAQPQQFWHAADGSMAPLTERWKSPCRVS